MTFPLRRLARESQADLHSRFEALARDPKGATAVAFEAAVCKGGVVTVNLKPEKLLSFLRRGRYMSRFELAREMAAETGREVEELLRESLDLWHDRRVEFEQRFAGSRSFCYGALNAGGLGPRCFGEFCLLTPWYVATAVPHVVFLAHDSLADGSPFRDAAGRVIEDALAEWVALCEDGGRLAALKHADSADLALPERLRRMCSGEAYIEALFVASLTVEILAGVRCRTGLRKELEQSALERVGSGGAVEGDEDLLLHDRILDTLDRMKIKLEEVEP